MGMAIEKGVVVRLYPTIRSTTFPIVLLIKTTTKDSLKAYPVMLYFKSDLL